MREIYIHPSRWLLCMYVLYYLSLQFIDRLFKHKRRLYKKIFGKMRTYMWKFFERTKYEKIICFCLLKHRFGRTTGK